MSRKLKILISGGGTGGHIFPAIAIADEIKKRFPEAEFLFIGAHGKMEMEKVPQAGYAIEGLNIAGFDRGNLLNNLSLPFKLISSLNRAGKLIRRFKPNLAIGTGGFASGPALYIASMLNVPVFVQEQNSLPGKTNVFLSKRAKAVYTAYPNMEHFFGQTPTLFLGNPVRKEITQNQTESAAAKLKLGLDPDKITVLSVGGSLGSRAINNVWAENIEKVSGEDIQLIWQTGKLDYTTLSRHISAAPGLQFSEFIRDMALAYSAADVIVSRAGAIAISELALTGKAVVLVPFPFAAEDHQTSNAKALVEKNAAKMVKDVDLKTRLIDTVFEVCKNPALRTSMSEAIRFFAKPAATADIVDDICTKLDLKQ